MDQARLRVFETAVGLAPLCFLILGGILLWIASWRRQNHVAAHPFAKRSSVLSVAAWLALLLGGIGMLGLLIMFIGPLAIVFVPLGLVGAAIAVVSAFVRYWRSEARFLVWSLAEAAERGIPLENAARAFAGERSGSVAFSARRLAEYLDAAMPLSVALARSGLWISADVKMAANLGEKTNSLGPSLQKAVKQSNLFETSLDSILVKSSYLAAILGVMFLVVTFMMIKIIPTFNEMFEQFGLELPRITQQLISVSRFTVDYWFLFGPLMAMAVGVVLLGILLFVGLPLHSLPLFRLFFSPVGNAMVLQSLAIAVRERQPIPDNLLLLSGFSQSPKVRRQLNGALLRIESGAHWTDALQKSGIVSKAQNRVLQAAERVGNLAWAMNEMADSVISGVAQRTQAVLSLMFPVCLLGFGACVMFVAVGMLLPLFSLIGRLA